MTYDELQQRINDLYTNANEENPKRAEESKAHYALRAVAELHKPMEENCECDREHVPTCEECVDDYPCSTIQAIEKELG